MKKKETMTNNEATHTPDTNPTTQATETKETPMVGTLEKKAEKVEKKDAETSIDTTGEPNLSVADKALATLRREMPEVAAKVEHLVVLMNPDKPGYEEMGGARWAPPVIRIHQALTRNPPGNSKLGNLITDTGDVLPTPFEFVPIYMHYAHTKFSQGGEDDKNRMCRSEDTVMSMRGQVCNDCPDRPFREGQITQCKKSIEVFVFDKDFQNIYKLQFVKSSYKIGSKLYRQTSSGSVPWERVYGLGVDQDTQKDTGAKYFVFSATPTGEKTDAKYDPMARFIHEKISEARKRIKENVRTQVATAKDVVGKLPDDFAGSPSTAAESSKGPGLTNM